MTHSMCVKQWLRLPLSSVDEKPLIIPCFSFADERSMMDALPMKLRKDLAIHVHFNTLSKVKLFSDCDKTLLYDLVLKLKPVLYLPGDYVCKKVRQRNPFILQLLKNITVNFSVVIYFNHYYFNRRYFYLKYFNCKYFNRKIL